MQASQARLRTAFENSHLSLKTYQKGIDQAEASSRKLGFTDSEVRDSLGSLMTATGNYKKSVADLTVVQNLSRIKHVDATDATKMLTMAMTGSQRAVKALGIVVIPLTKHYDALGKGATAAAKAHAKLLDKYATGDAVIAKVSERVRNQAKAFAATAAGGMAQFRAQLDHLLQVLGTPLLGALSAAAAKASDFLAFIGKLRDAPSLKVAVDMVIAKGKNIRDDLQAQLDKVDWGLAGRRIGQALSAGIVLTDQSITKFIALLNAHASDFAQLGLVIALNIVNTAFDPAFYMAHWKLILSVAIAVIGRGMWKVGGVAAGNLIKGFFSAPIKSLATRILVEFYRLPVGAQVVARLVARVLTTGIGDALGGVRRLLGRVPGWMKAAFQVGAILAAVGAIQKVADWVHRLYKWLAKVAGHAWNIVVNVSAHVPGGGLAGKVLSGIRHTGGLQAGGVIPMAPGAMRGVDSVPALLTPGEIVLNRAQQQMLGGPRYLQDLFGFERFQHGGKVKKKKHRAPSLPGSIREAEARAAGTSTLSDDIAAYRSEERWVESELKRSDLTASERGSLRVKKIRIATRLRNLHRRQAKAASRAQRDYSQLPSSIQERIARARYERDPGKLLSALQAGEAYLKRQLNRKDLTHAQRAAIYDALTSIEDEIASVKGDTTGAVDTSADLQAQLDQANARVAAARLGENLANAFVATGVFAGAGAGGGSGGGGGDTYVIQSLVPPDHVWIDRLAGYATLGIGRQGFRRSSRERLGL